jgi:hypothetical protein
MKPACHKIDIPLTWLPILFLAFLPSCTHDVANLEELDTLCFDSQILPIIRTSCGMTGCHDGTAEGFLATDYLSIMEAVKPGDPRGSKLYQVITDIRSDDMMPPDRPLSQEQRTLIQVWIAQGAENIQCNP